jgi:HAMP domain-containing protein
LDWLFSLEAVMDRKLLRGIPSPTADQSFWLGRALEAREEARLEDDATQPRHSIRRQLDLQVLVNHGLTYSVPWHVRDLSLTGAFVEMDAAQLPESSYVEFVLRYRYQGRPIEHRIPATVTRVAAEGVALTFGHYDDQAYTDLTNLLYAK